MPEHNYTVHGSEWQIIQRSPKVVLWWSCSTVKYSVPLLNFPGICLINTLINMPSLFLNLHMFGTFAPSLKIFFGRSWLSVLTTILYK